jgi:hypothetical protein
MRILFALTPMDFDLPSHCLRPFPQEGLGKEGSFPERHKAEPLCSVIFFFPLRILPAPGLPALSPASGSGERRGEEGYRPA